MAGEVHRRPSGYKSQDGGSLRSSMKSEVNAPALKPPATFSDPPNQVTNSEILVGHQLLTLQREISQDMEAVAVGESSVSNQVLLWYVYLTFSTSSS